MFLTDWRLQYLLIEREKEMKAVMEANHVLDTARVTTVGGVFDLRTLSMRKFPRLPYDIACARKG